MDMRILTALVACCVLAGCNNQDAADQPAGDPADARTSGTVDAVDANTDAGFEAVAPGDYEVVRGDGTIDQLTILPGMTWATVFADGTAAGGTIFAQGGQNCFVTEGVEDHQCFDQAEIAADGSMEVIAADGEVMTVRPVESFD
jgi:outer membrane murein-binding lipoprotein Lpp